ncbi:MAG: hypothetical protein IKS19_02425 [Clostridia bacterium]|nr:hypothetical protein [Clostridia bacterium]
MRTVSELLKHNGRVYVYSANERICRLFLENAEREGFTSCTGEKPTRLPVSDIFTLNSDKTINYVGFIGHMAFQNPDAVLGKTLIRVDYGRYLSGREDYLYNRGDDVNEEK